MITKKILSIMLVVAVLATIFVGCGQNEATTATTEPASTQTTTEKELTLNEEGEYDIPLPLSDETVTFTIWGGSPAGGNSSGSGMESYNDSIARQEMERRTNVHIEWNHPVSGQEATQFNLMIASNEYTDGIFGSTTYYIGGLDKYIDQDVLIDLAPYAQYYPNYNKVRSINEDCLRETVTDKGRIASFWTINYTPQPSYAGFFVRGDWAEELGIDLENVKTYDDWHEMLTTFKNGISGIDFSLMEGYCQDISSNLLLTGRNCYDTFYNLDGKMYYGPYTEEWKDHVLMMKQWYEEGLFDQDFFSHKSSDTDTYALNNRVAVASSVYINADRWDMMTDAENPDWTPIAHPIETDDTLRKISVYSAMKYAKGISVQVSTACSEELIPVFCQWMDYQYTKDGSILACYGVQGESFEFDENGDPYFLDIVTNNPEGLSQNIMQARMTFGASGVQGWYDWNREISKSASEKQRTGCAEAWEANSDPEIQPQLTIAEEHASDYSAKLNEIQTYVDEWAVKVVTGTQSPDTYDDFIAEIERMGMKELLEWQQAALDAYYNRDLTVGMN